MIIGVAAIDEQITLLEKGGDLLPASTAGPACHHQDATRAFQLADEVLEIGGSLNLLALSATVQELLRLEYVRL